MSNEKNHGKIFGIIEVMGIQRCAKYCSFLGLSAHKEG